MHGRRRDRRARPRRQQGVTTQPSNIEVCERTLEGRRRGYRQILRQHRSLPEQVVRAGVGSRDGVPICCFLIHVLWRIVTTYFGSIRRWIPSGVRVSTFSETHVERRVESSTV